MTPSATPTTVVTGTGKMIENRAFFDAAAPNSTPTPAGVQWHSSRRASQLPPGTRRALGDGIPVVDGLSLLYEQ